MAKNISLMGADYPDVPAVVLPKTGGGSATFVDADTMAMTMTIVSGKFASSEGFSSTIAYPAGFDKDNSVVLSLNANNGNNWRYGVGMTNAEASERTFADLITAGIRVYTSQASLFGNDFRVVLVKTS